jgi:hypothetical protein
MEHAIWIKKNGEEEYISIKKVKSDLGKDAARLEKYKCPSKKCGVKMITIFPKQKRKKGKETHSDHFRANPKPHKSDCGGDGERKDVSGDSTGIETDAKPHHDVVKQSPYLVRYVRRSPLRRGALADPVRDRNAKPEQKEGEERETRWKNHNNSHTSEPETGHIRGIVEAYENPPEELSKMKLVLPGCPARNYKDAFVDVDQVVDERGILGGYYIYKGAYNWHKPYPNNTIAIYFTREFPNLGRRGSNWKVGVWIEKTLEPDAKRDEIKGILKRADRERNATIYVFGRFQLYNDWKYSIEVEAFGDLWITFPANSSTRLNHHS